MPSWTTPNLPQLRYDQAAFKASHNSYERDERPVTTQFWWDNAQPHQGGCRGIELDIQQSEDFPSLWSVNHGGGYRGEVDKQFSLFLDLLHTGSTDRPGHDVITVTVDLKSVTSDPPDFGTDLDSYIAAHFDQEKLFTPQDLEDKFAADGTAGEEWPLLTELKGRFVFCLSGSTSWKERYRTGNGALCFTDSKANNPDDVRSLKDGSIFYNLNWEIWSRGIGDHRAFVRKKWIGALAKLASNPRIVTRAYGLNDDDSWDEARRSGINLLATDKVKRHEWAKVGDQPFGSAIGPLSAAGSQ